MKLMTIKRNSTDSFNTNVKLFFSEVFSTIRKAVTNFIDDFGCYHLHNALKRGVIIV